MSLDRLLSLSAGVYLPSGDVVDGRRVSTRTLVEAEIAVRIVDRDPADVVFDTGGEVIVDADAISRYPLELGQELDVSDGRRFVVSGRPKARRRRGPDVAFVSAPLKSRP